MRKRSTWTISLTLLALAAIAGGCAGRSKPATFYVLTARAEAVMPTTQDPQLTVGPIDMPAYLDRPQIVTRLHNGQLEVDEFNRWAQPLGPHLNQVLADNLAALTGSERVIPALTVRVREGYRIVGVVSRFEPDESGQVILQVTWAVQAVSGSGVSSRAEAVRRSLYKEPFVLGEPASAVEAMNRLLLRWSRDIAAVL